MGSPEGGRELVPHPATQPGWEDDPNRNQVIIDPNDPDHIAFGYHSNLYRFDDNGEGGVGPMIPEDPEVVPTDTELVNPEYDDPILRAMMLGVEQQRSDLLSQGVSPEEVLTRVPTPEVLKKPGPKE